MTELDFDELDRSINSAMSSETKTVDNSNSEAPAPAARPSLAIRRRGQFMDMVHPSSDMTRSAERPVSRRAAEIKPMNVPEPSASSENTSPATAASLTSPSSSALADSTAPSARADFNFDMEATNETNTAPSLVEQADVSEKFDPIATPLDLQPNSPASPVESPENTNTETTAPINDLTDDEDEDIAEIAATIEPADTSEVPVSPFLPDARPEKRPLDALQPTSVPTLQQMDDLSSNLQEQLDVLQPKTDQPDESKEVEAAADSSANKTHQDLTSEREITPVSHQEMAAVLQEPRAEVATGPTSIPQQYTENQAAEQPSGAIYDTAQYHNSVNDAPKAKKAKKAYYWIVWVVVLLFAGVAAGAGYFFLTMR